MRTAGILLALTSYPAVLQAQAAESGTFDRRNAVGFGEELVILLIIVAILGGGLVYVVRARPDSDA